MLNGCYASQACATHNTNIPNMKEKQMHTCQNMGILRFLDQALSTH